MPICSRCNLDKPAAEFIPAPSHHCTTRCVACRKAHSADYYRANRERCKAWQRVWYREHREQTLAQQAEHARKNRDKINAWCRAYYAANPEIPYQKNLKRKLLKRGVEYQYIRRPFVFRRDGWVCQLCGKPVDKALKGTRSPGAPTLDHIIPLSKGGSHTYGNVQLAHWTCNAAKGARLITVAVA
jgi:5-methylcytosine-specific restriction endonuclease McrA